MEAKEQRLAPVAVLAATWRHRVLKRRRRSHEAWSPLLTMASRILASFDAACSLEARGIRLRIFAEHFRGREHCRVSVACVEIREDGREAARKPSGGCEVAGRGMAKL